MSRARRVAWIGASAVAVAALGWLAGWRHPKPNAPAPNSYVDARRCQACHAAIHSGYQHVGMARSFAPISQAPAIEDYERNNRLSHAPSGRHYEMMRRGGRVFQRRYELDAAGAEVNSFELEATYIIGSGNHARTYLSRSESGELIELPVTWYTQENRWGMSPGFVNAAPPDFTRLADESCLFCHNGYPAAGGALAEGIDCQRCHGPGSRHVEAASVGNIVNPARLSPELQMDICMQCHLETTSAALPAMLRRFDREPYSFRPGEPLSAYMIHFDHAPGAGREDKFEIVGQAYRLRQSKCFRNSQGRLTCVSCHDPHVAPRGEAAVAWYRTKCVTCHASVAGASHPDIRTADCASCHMQKRRTEDAVHVIMTDHLIQRKPPSRDPARALPERTSIYQGSLVVYYPPHLSSSEQDLYLGAALITGGADRRAGIAILERAIAKDTPAKALAVLGEGYLAEGDATRAIDMFRRAAEKDTALGKVRYNLGQALEAAGRLQEARPEYEQATHMLTPFPEAHYALANLLVKLGEPARAIAQYQDALRERPVYAEANSNLANVYADQGRLDDARAELELALRVNPAFAEAHNNLARVLAAQNRIAEALVHARRAVALNAGYAEARYNLGRLLQATGAREPALAEYRRALAINPSFAEAHLALGQALGDAGRIDAAIAEFREVLRLRPGQAEAQRNLDLALAMKSGGGR